MRKKILQGIEDAKRALEQLSAPSALEFIEQGALMLAACFQTGSKVIIAGNGGSLCDASHFAEELTGVFRKKRRALPAIALSEPGHLSCVANDLGYDQVFSRAIEAYGARGDVFIGLSTSGNSPNIVRAFERARELGLHTVAFLGKDGGTLKGFANLELLIEGFDYSDRIQEAHMTAIHMMIELVEELLFGEKESILKNIMAALR